MTASMIGMVASSQQYASDAGARVLLQPRQVLVARVGEHELAERHQRLGLLGLPGSGEERQLHGGQHPGQIVQRLQSVFALEPIHPRPRLAQLGIQCRPDRVGHLAGRIVRIDDKSDPSWEDIVLKEVASAGTPIRSIFGGVRVTFGGKS